MIRLDRSSALLAVGSTLGLLLAAGSLLASGRSAGHALPPDMVARVNGVPIRAEDYRRAPATDATIRTRACGVTCSTA